jgi:hypothetical protein
MNSILFFLALMINALYADVDSKPEDRAKSVYPSSKMSYWTELQEEMELKKRKKYRSASTASNEKGANQRPKMPMTTSLTDQKISLSKEPSRYNPESNNDLKPLLPNTHELIAQVRLPDYLLQD